MKNIKYGLMGILVVAIFSLSILSAKTKEKEIQTNSETK